MDYISYFVVQQRVSHPVEQGQVLECTPYDLEELHEGIIIRFITRDEGVIQGKQLASRWLVFENLYYLVSCLYDHLS